MYLKEILTVWEVFRAMDKNSTLGIYRDTWMRGTLWSFFPDKGSSPFQVFDRLDVAKKG